MTFRWHRHRLDYFTGEFDFIRALSPVGALYICVSGEGKRLGAVGRSTVRERDGWYDWWCSDQDMCGPHHTYRGAKDCFEERNSQ